MPETNIKYWMSTVIEKIRFFKKKEEKNLGKNSKAETSELYSVIFDDV